MGRFQLKQITTTKGKSGTVCGHFIPVQIDQIDCSPCPQDEWDGVVIIFKFALIDLGSTSWQRPNRSLRLLAR